LPASTRRSVDTALDKLVRGKAGGKQHKLGRDLAGKKAIDMPGTGRQRGAGRIIYQELEDGTVNLIDITLKHYK